MKKGLTLIEVLVTVVIASIIISSILVLLNFITSYQHKRENIWKANKLVENIHARYLSDPSFFDKDDCTLYFDDYLNDEVSQSDADFTVNYDIELVLNEVTNEPYYYEMTITDILYRNVSLNLTFNLGRWVPQYEQA